MALGKVACIGSATIDCFVHTARKNSQLMDIRDFGHDTEFVGYPLGGKLLIDQLHFFPGGGGTNAAKTVSTYGHTAHFLGTIANDNLASWIESELQKNRVKNLARKMRGQSGYSVILDAVERDRTIFAFKGVNDQFKATAEMKKLSPYGAYLTSMMGPAYAHAFALVRHYKKKGAQIMFNPSAYLAKQGTGYLGQLLAVTDIVVLNKNEAELLTGNRPPREMMAELQKLGPQIVLVTDGPNGVYGQKGHHAFFVPGRKVKLEETTGAGDAFGSGFFAAWLDSNDMEKSVKAGMANAEGCIGKLGAQNGLLGKNGFERAMKEKRLFQPL
jgi:ribokinase